MNFPKLPSVQEDEPNSRALRSLRRSAQKKDNFGERLLAALALFQNNAADPVLWRVSRQDMRPLLLICLLPLLVALPQLLGWLKADPLLYVGGLTKDYVGGFLPGVPYIDPNNGFQTQALGYRAALDWLHGQVPWWNPYSGVGLPLAAEYSPGAFFPLIFLLLLPNGIVWQHVLLQVLAGWGSYGLLRQLGLSRTAAFAGGSLYAFNGALTWFDHSSAMPVPFLPWMLWGLERAYAKSALGLSGGWRMFAIAMAMNLLAAFPETAYLNGLLCLAWAVLRWAQTAPGKRKPYIGKVALGGIVGVLLCAPQILAFFEYLPHAWLGAHDGAYAHVALPGLAALPSLVAPHVLGPPFGLAVNGLSLNDVYSNIGGYVTLAILLLAIYGVIARRDALGWLMLGWSLLALAKTFGFWPFEAIWNLIPGITSAAFYRYAPPTWQLCLIILAARCVDHMEHESSPNQKALFAVVIAMLVAVGASAAVYAGALRPHFEENWGLRYVVMCSLAWAGLSGLVCLALLFYKPASWKAKITTVLLAFEAAMMCAVPTLCNPRSGTADMAAITFLRDHLDFQRFYTLGPIQPDYGGYFGIASINHNYLPIAQRWVDWIQKHLDSKADEVNFTGNFFRQPGVPSQAEELRKNLDSYEWAGVKYVVTSSTSNPFIEAIESRTAPNGNIPLALQPGQSITGILPASLIPSPTTITSLSVFEGNYNFTADGMLKATLCVNEETCANGSADLRKSPNNAPFEIALSEPLQVAANTSLRYTFTHEGGSAPVALWAFPTTADQAQNLVGPAGAANSFGLRIKMHISTASRNMPKLAYSDELMHIYELANPKPYFEAVGGPCTLQATERTRVIAECQTSADLIRRELFFPGWEARVNGSVSPITEHGELFQAITLPAGKSEVRFAYAPPHIVWAWLAMWLAILLLGASFFRERALLFAP